MKIFANLGCLLSVIVMMFLGGLFIGFSAEEIQYGSLVFGWLGSLFYF